MTRDKQHATAIYETGARVIRHSDQLEALEAQACAQGAEAHFRLYAAAAASLREAARYLRDAGRLMDPDVTDVETWEGVTAA